MALSATDSLLDALRDMQLLRPGQFEELTREAPRFGEARALAQYVLQRGWLTPYQVNQLILERGPDLVLGQYVLLERLGEGVRGQVFKARHRHMQRTVALKVIRKELLADADAVQRFYQEIQAASHLDHPNVVHAYDAGPVGPTHVLAMEYVKGTDLARLVRQDGPLSVPRACAYVAQAALGLQHAFERGLVHRDIKPSNLLVACLPTGDAGQSPDGDSSVEEPAEVTGLYEWGQIKILDFGLARLNRFADDPNRPLTHEGAMVGTPDFMAPEQAADARAVDIRADLYSLGCTFYFLLTGRPPFPGGSYIQKVDGHRWQQPEPLEKLRPELSPEVAAAVGKLMAKAPEERFQRPAEVAATLANLMGVSISAPPMSQSRPSPKPDESATLTIRPPSGKGSRRWLLGGAAVLFIGLVALSLWPRKPGPNAVAPEPAADTPAGDLSRVLARMKTGSPDPGEAWQSFVELRRRHPGSPEAREAGEWLRRIPSPLDAINAGNIPAADRIPGQPKEVAAVLGDQRWRHWQAMVQTVAYRPDGQVIASACESGEIWIWDARTGRLLALMAGHGGPVNTLAYSPDGRFLASGGRDKTIRLWDAVRNTPVKQFLGHKEPVRAVTFSRDSRSLVSGSGDKTARLWSVPDGKLLKTWAGDSVGVTAVAIAADGQIVATGGEDGSVRLWDTDGPEQLRAILPAHGKSIRALVFAPKGDLLVSGGEGGGFTLWDASVQERKWSKNHGAKLEALAFTPDGKLIVSAGERALRRWQTDTGAEKGKTIWVPTAAHALAVSPDGRKLAIAAHQPDLVLCDLTTDSVAAPPFGHRRAVRAVAFSSDARTLLSGGLDATVKRWAPVTGKVSATISGGEVKPVQAMACSPDERVIAAACWLIPEVHVFDSAGKPQATLTGHKEGVHTVAFSPDGRTVATAGMDETVRLWEVSSGRERLRRPSLKSGGSVAFSPDGRLLAYAGPGYTVRIYDRFADRELAVCKGHSLGVESLAFAPDGQTLASGGTDRTVRIWDVGTGKERAKLDGHDHRVMAVVYAPDGATLISAGLDGKVICWKPATATKERVWKLPGSVFDLALAADGRHLATANANGTVYLFRLAPAPALP